MCVWGEGVDENFPDTHQLENFMLAQKRENAFFPTSSSWGFFCVVVFLISFLYFHVPYRAHIYINFNENL